MPLAAMTAWYRLCQLSNQQRLLLKLSRRQESVTSCKRCSIVTAGDLKLQVWMLLALVLLAYMEHGISVEGGFRTASCISLTESGVHTPVA